MKSPEVGINSLEPGLLPGQSSVAEDGFEVDPPSLDLVEVLKMVVQLCQPPLPQSRLVGKPREVWGVLKRLQQTLVVPHLWGEAMEEDVYLYVKWNNLGMY